MRYSTIPDNTDNLIDSRDIIHRYEELKSEYDSLQEDLDEAQAAIDESIDGQCDGEEEEDDDIEDALAADLEEALKNLDDWIAEYEEELHALEDLIEQGECIRGWHHGVTLIHDDYFADYAKDLAQDLGLVEDAYSWPFSHIDWASAADELSADYSDIDFDGETYWVKA